MRVLSADFMHRITIRTRAPLGDPLAWIARATASLLLLAGLVWQMLASIAR